MDFDKIVNLLNSETDDNVPRYITRKWIEVHDQSNNDYDVNKPIRFKTPMLRSDLCDYSDAYVWVRGTITIVDANNNVNFNRQLTLKNNAPFISCISKINGELVENAEDLDVVMPMYNLLEYSGNYQKTSGSLFNYYRDEPKSDAVGNIDISIRNSKSFDYKTKITESLGVGELEKDNITIAIPLKHLGNFWKNLDIRLTNCEITLKLTWYNKCILVGRAYRAAAGPPVVAAVESPTNATFRVTSCRLYVPVVTLPTKNDNKLLDKLKSGFRRTIKWNEYVSEIPSQARNDNLNCFIDPTFINFNRLFVLSFENENERTSYYKYHVPNVEIKDYNVLIDGKDFLNC